MYAKMQYRKIYYSIVLCTETPHRPKASNILCIHPINSIANINRKA
jgi:hypothetical protein